MPEHETHVAVSAEARDDDCGVILRAVPYALRFSATTEDTITVGVSTFTLEQLAGLLGRLVPQRPPLTKVRRLTAGDLVDDGDTRWRVESVSQQLDHNTLNPNPNVTVTIRLRERR
jgi:hypothetical protein